MLYADGKLSKATATPLLSGSTTAQFLFNILANREETDVLSWYPADAEISFSGHDVLSTSLLSRLAEIFRSCSEWTGRT